MRFYKVWAWRKGELIERRFFVDSIDKALRKFRLQTGLDPEGCLED